MENGITRSRAVTLIAGLFLPLAAVFALDAAHGTYSELLRATPPGASNLLTGSFARRADSWVARESWTMRRARPWWNETMVDLFHETAAYVVVGDDGWLFTEPALKAVDESGAHMKAALDAVDLNRRFMSAHGTRLLLFVIPSKSRLYAGRVPAPELPASRRRLYDRTLDALRARGFDAFDVRATLESVRDADPGRLLFPPNDTHMSQLGFATVTERVIAPALGVPAEEAARRIAALPRGRHLHPGNLPHLLSIRPQSRVGRALSYSEATYLAPTTLDAPGADVIVFGDSYGDYYEKLFPRLIAAATGLTVDARFAGWFSQEVFQQLAAEFRTRAPRFAVTVVTEQRFAAP